MQSIQLHREINNIEKALLLVNEAIKIYRNFYKLWLIKAHLLEQSNRVEETRKTYEEALTVGEVKKERVVWINYAEFEERQEAFTRARTIL